MVNYPAQIDDSISLPAAIDNQTPVAGVVFNRLRDAILAIEGELGTKPSGVNSTVKARLDSLENIVNSIHVISLAQDLGGTLTAPLVIGLQGRPLSDVAPNAGQVLGWDGIAWVPSNVSGGGAIIFAGDLSGGPFSETVTGLLNRPLSTTAPAIGQTLIWDGAQWTASTNFQGQNIDTTGSLLAGPTVVSTLTTGLETLSGKFIVNGIPTVATLSDPGQGIIYFDSSINRFVASESGGAYALLGSSGTSFPFSPTHTVNPPYTALSTDYLIAVNGGGTITLLASPTAATTFIVKDLNGTAGSSNITINGNGNNIDGASTYVISANYESITIAYTGTEWSII